MAVNSDMYRCVPPIYLDELQLTANTYLRIDGKDMYYFALPVKKNDEVQGQDSEGLGQAANSAFADNTHMQGRGQSDSTCSTSQEKPSYTSKVKDLAQKAVEYSKRGDAGKGCDMAGNNSDDKSPSLDQDDGLPTNSTDCDKADHDTEVEGPSRCLAHWQSEVW